MFGESVVEVGWSNGVPAIMSFLSADYPDAREMSILIDFLNSEFAG
jgi:hypothetical protein